MTPRVQPKVSHLNNVGRPAATPATYPGFRPGETWFPTGYRAELGAAFLCADLALASEPPLPRRPTRSEP